MSSSSSDGRSGALMISAIKAFVAVHQSSTCILVDCWHSQSWEYAWQGKSQHESSRLAQLCSMLEISSPRYRSALMIPLMPSCEHGQRQWPKGQRGFPDVSTAGKSKAFIACIVLYALK